MTGALTAQGPRHAVVGRPLLSDLLILRALLIRLHGLNQTLVTFHPTRHYRSAVIARGVLLRR